MDGSGSERKRWRKWRGREIPTTDKGSVSFINSLVHCSAAQLIQAVNSCLSHFIGATSHPPCQSWQPSEARKVASYGWGKIEWNRNEWSRMGHREMKESPLLCSESRLYFLSHVASLLIWELLSSLCERHTMMAFYSWYKLQPFTLFPCIYREPVLGWSYVCPGTPCLTWNEMGGGQR